MKVGPTPHRRSQVHQPATGRWSLRARLIALVVAVTAVALGAVAVLLPLNVRSSLISERDNALSAAIGAINLGLDFRTVITSSENNSLRGGLGWMFVPAEGVIDYLAPGGDQDARPAVGRSPAVGVTETVPDQSERGEQYRILAIQVQTSEGLAYLVAWSSITDITDTVHRLVLLELLAAIGLLVLLGVVAGLIIRRELRPLESMATAADEIAAGDLDRRVPERDPGTEVGRLGSAFNGMLDGIGDLLDERTRGEDRLRQFVADASHELRTPVAAVQGYSDLYRAGALPDEAAVSRAMERMGFEARRMGALVEDLLTLIRADAQERTTKESVDLSELLTGVVDDGAVIDRARTWRLVGTGAKVFVLGDRLRLHQLFANLLANVRTHTPAGTVATVSLLPGTEEVAVAITDDGPGVADADLPRLFDRFFRADASRSRENGGSGLGLSIVAAIVRAHGGRILASHAGPDPAAAGWNADGAMDASLPPWELAMLDSHPGRGLTMTVVLPLATGTAAVSAQTAPPGIPAPGTDVTGVTSEKAITSTSSVGRSFDL